MPRPASRAPPPSPPASRGALLVALVLACAGLALSIFLARLHAQAHAGLSSFCAVNDVVNCDRVARSRFSVVLGLPVALWGALGYGLAAVLAAWGLSRRRAHTRWPAGLLFVTGAAAALVSIGLALVSKLAIGAWCLLCIASWALSAGLLAAGLAACRTSGVGTAVRSDLAALRERPARAWTLGGTALAAVAMAFAFYPRYWERPAAAAGPAPELAQPAGLGSTVVVEYSDYECPYCARAHEETRALLAGRPGVTLVRRQFPLDTSCNPALKRQIHPSACALARVGICAEEQGRLPEMDDALFRNQSEGAPVVTLAARLGLDVERFRACLQAPATERRLAADIAAGIRDGVRATPTYVVGKTVRAGQLPVELLAPPAAGTAR